MNILSKVFAITSPPTVRQEIKDDENDWQEWKIKNATQNEKCESPSSLLPDIQSSSYISDGDKLNATLWLSKTYSEEVYEDILKNETFSDISEIPSDFSSSLQLSNLSRSVQFVMAIDIVSVLTEGIDYTMELSSPQYDTPYWTENIYEISAFGSKKLVDTTKLDTFPYNDKKFVEFSIDLKSIGNPDKYKLLFYIVDVYPVNGKYCRIIDTSNWSLIPTPEFNIVPDTFNIPIRPPEEKSILVNINTNSDLESEAVLSVNYTNYEEEEKGEKKVNIKFISDKITVSPFTNNNAKLSITALEDKQLKEEKEIPIKISANISFPQSITNRGGDTYYNNKTISISKFSDLTLTVLPPYPLYQPIIDFFDFLDSIGVLATILTLIAIISAIYGLIKYIRKRKIRKRNKRVNNKQQKSKDQEINKI
ncbi:MAG: hypothetical protein ACRD6U_04890 [Nitrososphaeraceae archaeon]